jgi:DNA repair exonuclease SbcCD ATPase subunit
MAHYSLRCATVALVLALPFAAVSPGAAAAAAEGKDGSRVVAGVFLRELSSFNTEAVAKDLRLSADQSSKVRAIHAEFVEKVREHAKALAAASAKRAEVQKNIGGAVADRDKALADAKKKLEDAQGERERIRKAIEASKPGSPEREALKKQREEIIPKIESLKADLQKLASSEREKIDNQREKKEGIGSDIPPTPDFGPYRARMMEALTAPQRAEIEKRLGAANAAMNDLFGPGWSQE